MTTVYLCYAQPDEPFAQELDAHLAALREDQRVDIWQHARIEPGADWHESIVASVDSASLVILLLSADLLASDGIARVALDRAIRRHHSGTTRVVPVLVRACDWKTGPLGSLQTLPRNGRPVATWDRRDDAWVTIVGDLRATLAVPPPDIPVSGEPISPPQVPRDWRRVPPKTTGVGHSFVPPDETEDVRGMLRLRYGWVYGAHGIGKTSLVRFVIDEYADQVPHIAYIDCRAHSLIYRRPADAILSEFGLVPPSDEAAALRTLRSLILSLEDQTLLVLDEFDTFDAISSLPVAKLFVSTGGAIFISATPPELLGAPRRTRVSGSGPPMGSVIELAPFEQMRTAAFFAAATVPWESAARLARLSGGNPTLINLLTRMWERSGDVDPLSFNNRRILQFADDYFNRIWSTLSTPVQTMTILRTLLALDTDLADRANAHGELWRRLIRTPASSSDLALSIESPYSTGAYHDVVSPLFMTWALMQHGPSLSGDSVVMAEGRGAANVLLKEVPSGIPSTDWTRALHDKRNLSAAQILDGLVGQNAERSSFPGATSA